MNSGALKWTIFWGDRSPAFAGLALFHSSLYQTYGPCVDSHRAHEGGLHIMFLLSFSHSAGIHSGAAPRRNSFRRGSPQGEPAKVVLDYIYLKRGGTPGSGLRLSQKGGVTPRIGLVFISKGGVTPFLA